MTPPFVDSLVLAMTTRLVMRMRVRVTVVAVQAARDHAALRDRCLLHRTLAQTRFRLASLHLTPLCGRIDQLGAAAAHG